MISWRPGPGQGEARPPAAALLSAASARQATSPTALVQARLPAPRARGAGAFARPVADAIARWAGRGQG